MRSRSEDMGEKWIADSGASFHTNHSAYLLSDVRQCDKVMIGDNRLIDIVGHGTLIYVFPEDLTVKLLDVAYMPDIAFNVFSVIAAHRQGVRFTTEEEALRISPFDGRLGFEGDESSFSGFACRIEPGDGHVPFPLLTPNPPEDCVQSGCDFLLAYLVLASCSNACVETGVDINYWFPRSAWSLERTIVGRDG